MTKDEYRNRMGNRNMDGGTGDTQQRKTGLGSTEWVIPNTTVTYRDGGVGNQG